MRTNSYPSEKNGRQTAAWAVMLGLLLLMLAAGFFILYRFYEESLQQAQQMQDMQQELQYLKNENLLLEDTLAQREAEMNQMVTGVVSRQGVQDYRAYLTFDDGPCENTLKVMDILDEYGIKATFFMNGQESELAKEVYTRTIEDGHVLANHTYSHVYSDIYQSWDVFYSEIQKMEACVREQTGYEVARIVRFPGGSNCGSREIMQELKQGLEQLGYRYFDWNVSGEDAIYSDVPGSEVYNNVVRYVKGKNIAVILLHTTNKTDGTVEVLPDIIEYLQQEGYTFHTLDEEDAPTYVVFDRDYR